MIIGVDFDNTMVCYDGLFQKAALDLGLTQSVPSRAKSLVKNHLHDSGRVEEWVRLQGVLYGERMPEALPFPGCLEFFAHCARERQSVCVISFRTQVPLSGSPIDLHEAGRKWLARHSFTDPSQGGLDPTRVWFETSVEKKLQRIAQMGCTHFIDDLPEVLEHPAFPPRVEKILWDPGQNSGSNRPYRRAASWGELETMIAPGKRG